MKKRFLDENFKEYCKEMMDLTIGEAILCYKRLKINRFDDILTNFFYVKCEWFAVKRAIPSLSQEWGE